MRRTLPWLLLAVLTAAVLLRGATSPQTSTFLYLGIAGVGLWAAAQPRLAAPSPGALALALGWSGLALASTLWSRHVDATLDASSAVIATALVFLLATLLEGRVLRRRFFVGFALLGGAVACTSLASVDPGERALFPFGNPNHLSAWLLMPLAVAFVATISEDLAARGRREDALLWFGLVGTMGAALAATGSLGAGLAVVAALTAFLVLRRDARRGAAFAGLCFATTAVVVIVLPQAFPDWLPIKVGGGESSPGLRWAVYAAAGRAALAVAPLGAGLGAFDTAFVHEQPAGVPYAVHYAHSEPLHGLVELGIPFALLLTFTVVLVARQLGTRLAGGASRLHWGAATAVLALAAHCLVDFPLHIPAIALAGAVLVGTLWRGGRAVSAPSGTPRAPRLVLVALCLALLVLSGSQGVAELYSVRAEQAVAEGRFEQALGAAEAGLRWRPARPRLHSHAANAAEHFHRFRGGGRAMLERALAARERAIEANSSDARLRLDYARTLLLAGDHAGALAELDRATRLDPRSPVALLVATRVHLDAGEPGLAAGSLRQALERRPSVTGPALSAALRGGGPTLVHQALSSDARAHRAAASVFSRDGFLRDAAEQYEHAVAVAPSDVRSALHAAQHFQRVGDSDSAEAVLLRALAQVPADRDLQRSLAALRARRDGAIGAVGAGPRG